MYRRIQIAIYLLKNNDDVLNHRDASRRFLDRGRDPRQELASPVTK
jgi:hypothetical protein